MEKTEETDPSKGIKRNIWILTVVYIVVAGLMIAGSKKCIVYTHSEYWPVSLYNRWFGCLEANALGDMLAGIFAPLAFLWLAGAVYIQSKELSTQRKELNETQEVMNAQLEVARQQVEETEKSTAAAVAQTKILTEQHELAQREGVDKLFNATMDGLKFTLLELNMRFIEYQDRRGNWVPIPILQNTSESQSAQNLMYSFYLKLDEIRNLINSENGTIKIYRQNRGIFDKVIFALNALKQMVPSTTTHMRVASESLFIEPLIEVIEFLKLNMPTKP